MIPKPFTVYRMKESSSNILFAGPVKRCATECGNRFRYLPDIKSYANMECMRCGYKYHTVTYTFSERYEEGVDDLSDRDPNLLFKSKELSQWK